MVRRRRIKEIMRVISIGLILSIVFGSTVVYASESFDTSRYVPIRSMSKPSTIWDWTNGSYSFSGAADYHVLYTNYLFTGASTAMISVTNDSSLHSCTASVYSVGTLYDTCISSRTIGVGRSQTWSIGIFPSKEYYIAFGAPCKFHGSISMIN